VTTGGSIAPVSIGPQLDVADPTVQRMGSRRSGPDTEPASPSEHAMRHCVLLGMLG
jgi:hypothetical protein